MDHTCNVIDVLDVTNETIWDICAFIWWVFWKTNKIISKAFRFLYKNMFLYVLIFWIFQDESSQEKTKLEFTNTVEVNSSLCTTYSGFDAYTETHSSSSVTNLDGRYRIGVEVHYSGEVTALQSIQYFNTSFIFSKYIHSLFCRFTVNTVVMLKSMR